MPEGPTKRPVTGPEWQPAICSAIALMRIAAAAGYSFLAFAKKIERQLDGFEPLRLSVPGERAWRFHPPNSPYLQRR